MLSLLFVITALLATVHSATLNAVPNSVGDGKLARANPWYIGIECRNSKSGNNYGTCQYTSTCKARSGTADSNPDCPGPDNVQCCIFDDCVNGVKGKCADTRDWKCTGGGGFNQ